MLRAFKIENVFPGFHFLGMRGLFLIFLLFSFYANGQHNESLLDTSTDIFFRNKSTRLTKEAKRQLDSIAKISGSDTSLGIRLTISYRDLCDNCGGRAWDRVQRIATYLAAAGAVSGHISSVSFLDGETSKVEVSIVRWMNPSGAPPHPSLRKKKKLN